VEDFEQVAEGRNCDFSVLAPNFGISFFLGGKGGCIILEFLYFK
jgi:hypothetical protein